MSKKAPTPIDILYQDIVNIEERLAGLAGQVNRVQRTIKIDERIAAVHDKHSQAELLESVAQNTTLVSLMIKEFQHLRTEDNNGDNFHGTQKLSRSLNAKKNIAFDRYLAKCEQRIIPKCSCGQHKGIVFLEKETRKAVVGTKVYLPANKKYGVIIEEKPDYVVVQTTKEEIKTTINNIQIVVDTRCPESWWLTQVKLATLDGVGTQFVNSTPQANYLKGYILK